MHVGDFTTFLHLLCARYGLSWAGQVIDPETGTVVYAPATGEQSLSFATGGTGGVRLCVTEGVPNATRAKSIIVGAGGREGASFPHCRQVRQQHMRANFWCKTYVNLSHAWFNRSPNRPGASVMSSAESHLAGASFARLSSYCHHHRRHKYLSYGRV
eukprot:COSAG05_NODE_8073_length_739_cov_0.729688_1_plen_157_part_00